MPRIVIFGVSTSIQAIFSMRRLTWHGIAAVASHKSADCPKVIEPGCGTVQLYLGAVTAGAGLLSGPSPFLSINNC